MKILHLSDLHFKSQDISQDIVLSSLIKAINKIFSKESKPDILIITGDIAFSGKSEEYEKAAIFVNNICNICHVDKENIVLIPGNHDVDRAKINKNHINWWYGFKTEQEISDVLKSDESFPKIFAKNEHFYEFLGKITNNSIIIERYGQYIKEVKLDNEPIGIKIVGLNSSLFCGYDGDDKERLALGLDQVNACDQVIDSDSEIIISCIHHPLKCFHPSDRTSLTILQRFSDIILSGHVHETSTTSVSDGIAGKTVFLSAGSAYEWREKENGFNIIELDLIKLNGSAITYKYLSKSHEWIINKDINRENNGAFKFKIHKQLNDSVQEKKTAINVASIAEELQFLYENDDFREGLKLAEKSFKENNSHLMLLKHVLRFNMRDKNWQRINEIANSLIDMELSDEQKAMCMFTLFECNLREGYEFRFDATLFAEMIRKIRSNLNQVPTSQKETHQYYYLLGRWHLEMWWAHRSTNNLTNLTQAMSCFNRSIEMKNTWWTQCYLCIVYKLLNHEKFEDESKNFQFRIFDFQQKKPLQPSVKIYCITALILIDDCEGLSKYLKSINEKMYPLDFEDSLIHRIEMLYSFEQDKLNFHKNIVNKWIANLPRK